jgi:hypothetical protein
MAVATPSDQRVMTEERPHCGVAIALDFVAFILLLAGVAGAADSWCRRGERPPD